jgi:hypothetical protein
MKNSMNSQQERARVERERGWIIFLLYHARPRALDVVALRRLLDARNIPLSSRRLAEHLSYFHELRLVKIEIEGVREALSEHDQERALQRYADSDTDGFRESMFLRLTAAGVNFQEGFGGEYEGISRIE